MFQYKYQTYLKDLSILRRHVMLSIARRDNFELVTYCFGDLLTFSIKTNSGEEVYPFFFNDKTQLLKEATHFLSLYDLRIGFSDEQKDKYPII